MPLAYVFHWTGSTWSEQQELHASDAGAGDQFGYCVDIKGIHVIVGAPYDDDEGTDAGAAYVFTRDGATWGDEKKLKAAASDAGDRLGEGVAIDGKIAVIGGIGDDTNGTYSGAAYAFTLNGTAWDTGTVTCTQLNPTDTNADQRYGYAVSVSGDAVIVGAMGDDVDVEWSYSGAAYVFRYSGTWGAATKIVPTTRTTYEYFGGAVSINGDTAVIGATGANSFEGGVYAFHYNGTSWSQKSKMTDENGSTFDFLGVSVALSGQTVVAGAYADHVDATDDGSACIFGNLLGGQFEQTWTYGETGNHTAITTDGATLSLAHDDDAAGDGGLANEITEVNSSSGDIAHDAAGNMTKVPIVRDGKVVGHRVHTYDAWNRLVKVETDASTPVTLAVMTYDGLGRRISKTVTGSGDMNATYKFFYDASTGLGTGGQRVIETHNGSDQVIKHNVWGPTYVDELVQVGVNTDPGSNNVMDDSYVILDDANFNVIGMMNDDHDLIERREYHPYGRRQVFKQRSSTDAQCTAEIPHPQVVVLGSTPQAYSICDEGHQGLMHDKEIDVFNNRARYTSPTLCRSTGRDPLDYIDGNNLYAYLMNNPGNGLDPWGCETGARGWLDAFADIAGDALDNINPRIGKLNRLNKRLKDIQKVTKTEDGTLKVMTAVLDGVSAKSFCLQLAEVEKSVVRSAYKTAAEHPGLTSVSGLVAGVGGQIISDIKDNIKNDRAIRVAHGVDPDTADRHALVVNTPGLNFGVPFLELFNYDTRAETDNQAVPLDRRVTAGFQVTGHLAVVGYVALRMTTPQKTVMPTKFPGTAIVLHSEKAAAISRLRTISSGVKARMASGTRFVNSTAGRGVLPAWTSTPRPLLPALSATKSTGLTSKAAVSTKGGGQIVFRPTVIKFPAKGLSPAQQQLFAAHLAEQEMALNRLSLSVPAELKMNILGYQNIKPQVAASRSLARKYLPGAGAGLDATHRLDAVAGGYLHDFAGFRNVIQRRIGSLWRTRARLIQPGRVHRLVPEFSK